MTQVKADIDLIRLLETGDFADWIIRVKSSEFSGPSSSTCSLYNHRNRDTSFRRSPDGEQNDEHQEFRVHSPILGLSSEYFRRVFEQKDFQESHSRVTELICTETVKSYFRLVLRYIYGATLHINCANVVQLYVLSDQLVIRKLHEKCCQLIFEQCEKDTRLDHFQILVNTAYRCGQAASSILDVCMQAATLRHWEAFAKEPGPLPQQFTLSLLMRKVLQVAVKLDDSIVIESAEPAMDPMENSKLGGLKQKFGKLYSETFDVYKNLKDVDVDTLRDQVSNVLLFELKRCIKAVQHVSSRYRQRSEEEEAEDKAATEDEKVDMSTSTSLGSVMEVINSWVPEQREKAEEILGLVIFAERYNSIFHVAKSLPVLKANSMIKLFVKVTNVRASLDAAGHPKLYKRYRKAAEPSEQDLKYWKFITQLADRLFHHLAIISGLVFYSRSARKLLRKIPPSYLPTLLQLDELYVEDEDEVLRFVVDIIRNALDMKMRHGYIPTEVEFEKECEKFKELFGCIRWKYISQSELDTAKSALDDDTLLPPDVHCKLQLGDLLQSSQEDCRSYYFPPRFSYANKRTLLLPAFFGDGTPGNMYRVRGESFELPRVNLPDNQIFLDIAPQIITRNSNSGVDTSTTGNDSNDLQNEESHSALEDEDQSYALIRADAALSSYQNLGESMAIQPYRASSFSSILDVAQRSSRTTQRPQLEDATHVNSSAESAANNESGNEEIPPLALEASATRTPSFPSEVGSDEGSPFALDSESQSSSRPLARSQSLDSTSADVESSPMFISMNRRALLRRNYRALRDTNRKQED